MQIKLLFPLLYPHPVPLLKGKGKFLIMKGLRPFVASRLSPVRSRNAGFYQQIATSRCNRDDMFWEGLKPLFDAPMTDRAVVRVHVFSRWVRRVVLYPHPALSLEGEGIFLMRRACGPSRIPLSPVRSRDVEVYQEIATATTWPRNDMFGVGAMFF